MRNLQTVRTACTLVLAALLGPLAALSAHAAQDWPERPIKLVVPYPAGAGADTTARIVAEKLGGRLGQPVVVDNRPGAATNIAMEGVIHAPADGYTLFFALPTVVQNPYLYKLRFDPRTELRAVSKLTEVSFVLLAGKDFAPRSLAEVLKLAAERPGHVTCGSPGATPGLGCELLRIRGKVDITVVPYKGNAPALTDLAGGQISLLFDLVSSAKPHVTSGRVRALATTNAKRGDPQFPDLPTVSETLPGFELTAWQGVMVPAKTPDAVVQRLDRELAAVMADPDVQGRLAANGLTPSYENATRFRQTLAREFTHYEKLIRETGMKGE
ncbi:MULTISPECIES: Bug family tripartite tricarboxylate transporter substrate binding protein [Ramlibacter]|uniref:Tripartite tricarboxylate transporter substrate binding protein n=1 Tax=Ramlibacter pinisoli TaxID=2682844 RepID=A0A6N8J244_9BURK|nr:MULTISPECIES: tripartite tricarboxylate transporter substrate binding protein [Ramlibacter]MBA2962324.1 tripartite tricarboxylate transporter substrate binding protein [Ramlibacter sp. CGMCC 1.13660]MVQ32266.1 tripartite tricarboxylate transporter substrate binding protein [Ramlibacter pinisoli]